MIVTSMQLTTSSRRDIAVLQKESSALEGEEDVNKTVLPEQSIASRTVLNIETNGPDQTSEFRTLLPARLFVR